MSKFYVFKNSFLKIRSGAKVTVVVSSAFFSVLLLSVHFTTVLVRWLGGSFEKLGLSRALCGFANVPPNALTKN